MEMIKKIALLLVVAIFCVACDKKEDRCIVGEPPELKAGLIRQVNIPLSIKDIEVKDYNGGKVFWLDFASEKYNEGTAIFNKICDNYSIDCTLPYLIPEGSDADCIVLGGEINNIELKCNQGYNPQYEAGSVLNSLLTLHYLDIKESLYDYKKLPWEKCSTRDGNGSYGWLFKSSKLVEINGIDNISLILPVCWENKRISLYLLTPPQLPGTYDFVLSMKVYTPIYGEKTMEKEFSMTWE